MEIVCSINGVHEVVFSDLSCECLYVLRFLSVPLLCVRYLWL